MPVRDAHNIRSLVGRAGAVLLDLRIMASVDNYAGDVFSIPERHASKGNVIVRKRRDIAIHVEVTVKLIDPVVWLFDIDDTIQILERALCKRLNQLLGDGFQFQICLSIEVLSLNVKHTFGFSRVKDDHVCREKRILMDPDDISNLREAPLFLFETVGLLRENFTIGIVLSSIFFMSLIVFICVLDHGEDDDEGQGRQHSWLSIRDGYHCNHLHEHDDQEVEICQLRRELLK